MTTAEIIGLSIWMIVIVGMVYWGQTFDRQHYDFLGKRKIFLALSSVLVILCIAVTASKGLRMGLDFSGGTIIEFGSYKMLESKAVEEALADFPNVGQVHIQLGTDMITDLKPEQGKPDEFQKVIVRLTLDDGAHLNPEQTKAALEHLHGKLGEFKELRTASIGPTISGELTVNAIKALTIALVAQLIYIFFRFGNQIRYGLAANLALIHDLIVMVGFYALAGEEVDSPFVAALLTVVGYSVMDSVVIFDRIQENLNNWWAEHGEEKEAPYERLVNDSLCQTMSRSINTMATVLVCLLALHYFGGESLQNFSYALLVGIVGGGYSSIALAGPIVVAINEKYPARPPSDSGNWYDTDEVVPEDHMEISDDAEDFDAPRTSGRRRSRGKRT